MEDNNRYVFRKWSSTAITLAFLLPLFVSFTAGDDKGWEKIFNGQNLEGWIVPPGDRAWTVVNGVIDCDPKYVPPEKNLWTVREYRDFILRVEWRIKDNPPVGQSYILRPDGTSQRDSKGNEVKITLPNSDSGIFLRGETAPQVNFWCNPAGSGDITGYRVLSPPELLPGFIPSRMADNYVGDWNTFEITLIGDHLTVDLNGHTVIKNVQLPFLPDKGRIGLQHHGGFVNGQYLSGSSLVQFRNIYIKEIPRTPYGKEKSSWAGHKSLSVGSGKKIIKGNGVKDIDGNKYTTVFIGKREWMAGNLRTTHYNDGTPLPHVRGDYEWSNMKTPGYCWYNNDTVSGLKNTYGALYNWFAVGSAPDKGKNICPAGWHVPTNEEWTALTTYIEEVNDLDVGDHLKSGLQVLSLPDGSETKDKHPRWDRDEMHHGTDDYGFSALPAGARHVTGRFYDQGTGSHWWSSTSYYSTASWARHIYNDSGNVDHTFGTKRMGFSVRCIRD